MLGVDEPDGKFAISLCLLLGDSRGISEVEAIVPKMHNLPAQNYVSQSATTSLGLLSPTIEPIHPWTATCKAREAGSIYI